MSKKKFKAGLESLFGDTGRDDLLPGIRPLLVEEEQQPKDNRRTARTNRPRRRSSKNFTSDLEGLFHSALDKEYETVEKTPVTRRDTSVKKRNDRPVIGIDALIRRTSNISRDEISASTPLKKRVTFTLDKQKIERLKNIAKSRKAYLKDIMADMVADYLNKREEQPPSAN